MQTTKHSHAPNFGRLVADCPRCDELRAGAKPIQWRASRRAQDEQRTRAAIRAHDCVASRCGPVCTAFEW